MWLVTRCFLLVEAVHKFFTVSARVGELARVTYPSNIGRGGHY